MKSQDLADTIGSIIMLSRVRPLALVAGAIRYYNYLQKSNMKKFQITKKKILISAACLIVAGGILFGPNIYWVLRDLSEIPHDEKVAKMFQCMNENRDSVKTLAQGNPITDSETGISYHAGNGYIQATRGTKIIWKYDDYKMNSDGNFKLNKYDCNTPLVTIYYFYGRGCSIALNAATGDLIDSNVCGI